MADDVRFGLHRALRKIRQGFSRTMPRSTDRARAAERARLTGRWVSDVRLPSPAGAHGLRPSVGRFGSLPTPWLGLEMNRVASRAVGRVFPLRESYGGSAVTQSGFRSPHFSRRTVLSMLGAAAVVPGVSSCSSATGKSATGNLVRRDDRTMRVVKDFVSRAEWGADESKRFGENGSETSPPKFFPLQALTVHHTATDNGDPDPAATIRTMYKKHTVDKEWGDIGYHFLIDGEGRVYEGRFSGDDGMPAHDGRGNVVTAFHTTGLNSGNLGIALLGDLDKQPPTDAAFDALTRLLVVMARTHRLDPKSHITYKNPVDGTTMAARTVNGHQDWYETGCPGGLMYGKLDALRQAVSDGLAGEGPVAPTSAASGK